MRSQCFSQTGFAKTILCRSCAGGFVRRAKITACCKGSSLTGWHASCLCSWAGAAAVEPQKRLHAVCPLRPKAGIAALSGRACSPENGPAFGLTCALDCPRALESRWALDDVCGKAAVVLATMPAAMAGERPEEDLRQGLQSSFWPESCYDAAGECQGLPRNAESFSLENPPNGLLALLLLETDCLEFLAYLFLEMSSPIIRVGLHPIIRVGLCLCGGIWFFCPAFSRGSERRALVR